MFLTFVVALTLWPLVLPTPSLPSVTLLVAWRVSVSYQPVIEDHSATRDQRRCKVRKC